MFNYKTRYNPGTDVNESPMLKLEEITKDAQITGTTSQRTRQGGQCGRNRPQCRLVAYRNAQGKLEEQTVSGQDEHRLCSRSWPSLGF